MADGKEFQRILTSRLKELVESGELIQEDGFNKLHRQILKEFRGYKIGKRGLMQKIFNLVWNKNVDKSLQEIVRNSPESTKEDLEGILKEEFQPLYPYIPFDMVLRRAFWHRGVTKKRLPKGRGKTLPGIGRIGLDLNPEELKKFKMPDATFANPFKIAVRDPENWSLMFLNGANIGARHGGDIVGNVTRRALSDANERSRAAIIATNIIMVDFKKTAGPPKVGRSLVFGNNVNPNLIKEPEYRAIAERILAEHPLNEIIYQPVGEVFEDLMNGWLKIALKPDNKPEYKGPIYIVLGENEKKVIEAAAYWEVKWWTEEKQAELKNKLDRLKTARKAAERREESDLVGSLMADEETLRSQLRRTTVSNVATQEYQRFYEHARAVVVKKIENAIPNSKVIGQDTSFVEVAGKRIEINMPANSQVTDALLAHYANKYGSRNLQERLASIVVICHPYSLQGRMTVREADYDGKRGSSMILVAPIAIDDKYLRQVIKAGTSQDHPLARAVFSDGFKSGVLALNCVSGLVNPSFFSVESLECFKDYPKIRRESKNATLDRGSKYFWMEPDADPHYGGRSKEFVTCNIPGSDRKGMRLDMAEAVWEMMRQGGLCRNDNMRVHFYSSFDDQTQGQNFDARVQPHPHQLTLKKIDEIDRKMLSDLEAAKDAGDLTTVLEIGQKMSRFHKYQLEVRASDFPGDQIIQYMTQHIEANVDIFRSFLKAAVRANLIVKGVGEFNDTLYVPDGSDTRNCGKINIASGNHLEHTINGEIAEGPLDAKLLRAYLAKYPEWRDKEKQLEKDVVAPLYSGGFIGWGTVRVGSGHEYGLDIRARPAKMAGWGDTLLGVTRNMSSRGNYARIFNNRLPVICLYGDKHFFGGAITDCAVHYMSASGTHTDRYGEFGFPPNNTGVSFVGLPVDGPDKGPILIRTMHYTVIKDFVEDNPREFDWENFLPNPA